MDLSIFECRLLEWDLGHVSEQSSNRQSKIEHYPWANRLPDTSRHSSTFSCAQGSNERYCMVEMDAVSFLSTLAELRQTQSAFVLFGRPLVRGRWH